MQQRQTDHRTSLLPGTGINATLVAIVLSLLTSGEGAAEDFETGLKAFRSGDIEQALNDWRPLAEAGDANAQYALGRAYEYGYGYERNDAEAVRWYQKAAAQNNAQAQYRLGVLFDNGWGVSRNAGAAATWYSHAAHLGHVFAQHDLAFMYLNGTGVPKDRVQAYKWLRIASQSRADLMAKHLTYLSKTMTADEIAKAERLAWAWLTSQEI